MKQIHVSNHPTLSQGMRMLVLLLFLTPSISFATHIHGGDLTYKCLGNNLFEVTCRLYSECSVPLSPVTVYAFDQNTNQCLDQSNNQCVPSVTLQLVNTRSITYQADPDIYCITSTACDFEEHTFKGTLYLPANSNYRLVASQCCRVASTNVFDSDYTLEAPFADIINTSQCDQGAMFDEVSPWKACIGSQNCIDASVQDPDGDSIVYMLIATQYFDPVPIWMYQNATYVNPYGYTNMMGTNPNLSINSEGMICFTPTTPGGFFVTVQVETFRNSSLVGRVSKDLYVNVTNCPANAGHNLDPCFTIDDQFCLDDPIIADGGCSENEERHHWYVEELDSNMNRTFDNMWDTTLFDTASTFDLKAGYQQGGFNFEPGKCYRIALGVSRLCGNSFVWEGEVQNICIKDAPPLSAGYDRTICSGESTVLGEEPPVEDPYTYQWSTGATDAQITVSPTVGTSYLLTITGPNGCQTVDEVSVSVDAMAPLSPVIHAQDVCQGEETCINLSYSGIATQGGGTYVPYPTQVTYTFSDGSVYIQGASQIHDPVCRTFSTPGVKTVTVTLENACGTATATTTFEVFPTPSASINHSATDICSTSFSLNTQVTGGTQPYNYEWSSETDHGNYISTASNIGTGPSFTVSATMPYGITTYRVTVTDANGCTAVADIEIDFTVCCCVNWPGFTYDNISNIITPNGDGYNDTWVVYDNSNPVHCTYHAQAFQLQIYNRWGGLVFEDDGEGVLVNGEIMWNGLVDGSGPAVPDGTYYFTLTLEGCDDSFEISGTITVIGSGKRTVELDKPDPSDEGAVLHPADVKLFPNPSTDVFELQVSRVLENTQLIVTDYMGREVHRQPMAAGNNVTQSVDATAWSSGVYLYRLVQDNGYVAYRGRMVKAQP